MLFALRESAKGAELDIDVLDIIGRGFFSDGITAQAVVEALRSSKAKTINVRVNSAGGNVDEANAIRAILRERAAAAKINVTVIGAAASAATIITDAGTDVAIARGAYFMIHEASAGTGGRGTREDHERSIQRLKIANDALVAMYVAASERRGKGKTADEFRAEMDRERFFDATEAVAWGLADRVVEEEISVAACADISAFSNAPKALRDKYEATMASLQPTNQPAAVAIAAPAPVPPNPPAVHGGAKERRHAMTKEEVKAQHPEIYNSILEEGRKAGEATERDRVVAHLTLGESSGDMKTAMDAINSGAGMTAALTAKYMAAGMNRSAQTARQADSDKAGEAADGAQPPKATGTDGGKAAPATLVDLFASDLPAKKAG